MKNPKARWMRLDNAAKIYPAAKRKKWNNIFRLSATLKENVEPEVLQSALDVTVKRFPSIAVRIRRGMFWYYLEEIPQAPRIEQDAPYPLASMPFSDIRKCAFRVLYYEGRIAVEFFHSITDGNGGLVFLKTLIAEYLVQKHRVSIQNISGVLDRSEAPADAEFEDSFLKHGGDVAASRRAPDAFRLKGTPEPDGFMHLTTGILDSDKVLEKARSYGVTVTELLTAVMIDSLAKIQSERVPDRRKRKNVKVLVPVNLRKLFGSTSLRNFVLYVTPGIDPRLGDYTFEEILKAVHHKLGMDLTKKQMATMITANVNAEKSWFVKILPLFVKNIAMKTFYNIVGEKKTSLTLSNLGVVGVPEEMAPFIERFDFVIGVQATGPSNCGVISYNGRLHISFIRNTPEAVLERKFFRRLVRLGLNVKTESNQR